MPVDDEQDLKLEKAWTLVYTGQYVTVTELMHATEGN